ncbi:DUF1961 family protein [Lentisphaera profundi]|uniref:DUF1961 family protein n=1 Tax=Lentisphaera profundi TaxID=1658616 RepID=A0ABY7VVV9_9BACT|nr:DUF1961 family protein [Lentisphaera profundi]WDE97409.1 DUF1961 family protein [Lentisphaera profundi]
MMKYLTLFFYTLMSIHAGEVIYDKAIPDLNDWLIEGPGNAVVEGDSLILKPLVFKEMQQVIKSGELKAHNYFPDYEAYAKDFMSQYVSDLTQYYIKGEKGNQEFRGGHFNFWLKQKLPENFSISFDFETLSPSALHMIMFCASIPGKKDIFNPQKARHGLAQEIMWSDMQQYRISFFAPHRKTANMRRAPGRNMVAKGLDPASDKPFVKSTHLIERKHDTVRYFVNNKLVLTYKDKKPLSAGHAGFRVMVCAGGKYSNIKITKLENENE